eukprot:10216386-Alexandrium_andersonii.AAC.1
MGIQRVVTDGVPTNDEQVREAFEDIGYAVASGKFSPTDVGIPQNRQRVYYIGLNIAKYGKEVCARSGLDTYPQAAAQTLVSNCMEMATSFAERGFPTLRLQDFIWTKSESMPLRSLRPEGPAKH